MGKKIAVVGDSSDHGGSIISSGGGTLIVNGEIVAVNGALHSCPRDGHGTTPITAITTRSKNNGKLILTEEAVAGCGAKITPLDRDVLVE